jgi:peptide chain release factor subunit 1
MIYFKGRYFDEISQDTGRFCFGVDDTLKALEMGAVDILIVWENLDITRYVLKNHQTDGELLYVNVLVNAYVKSSQFNQSRKRW